MGMYDIINGFQVKCFTVPIYYGRGVFGLEEFKDYGLGFSGGSLRSYHVGDEVPYKTWWYDYTPDFNVIDADGEETVYKIRNGKVINVKRGNLRVQDFEGINLCVGYHGTMLHIKEYEEFRRFFKNIKKFRKIYAENSAEYVRACKRRRKDSMSEEFSETARQKQNLDRIMEPYQKELIEPYIYTKEEAMAKEGLFGGLLECMGFHMASLKEGETEMLELHKKSLCGCIDDCQRLCENTGYPLKDSFSRWSKMPISEIDKILEEAAKEARM